ncbi:MAG: hypothetical protein DME79_06930 [Verrucomicrobia bacterium]|nr:MAG: hypothetical protein DME79_06930 [Verrucomicrobiota bacterium]
MLITPPPLRGIASFATGDNAPLLGIRQSYSDSIENLLKDSTTNNESLSMVCLRCQRLWFLLHNFYFIPSV